MVLKSSVLVSLLVALLAVACGTPDSSSESKSDEVPSEEEEAVTPTDISGSYLTMDCSKEHVGDAELLPLHGGDEEAEESQDLDVAAEVHCAVYASASETAEEKTLAAFQDLKALTGLKVFAVLTVEGGESEDIETVELDLDKYLAKSSDEDRTFTCLLPEEIEARCKGLKVAYDGADGGKAVEEYFSEEDEAEHHLGLRSPLKMDGASSCRQEPTVGRQCESR